MVRKVLCVFFLSLGIQNVQAFENLVIADIVGKWVSTTPLTDDEKQTLIIHADYTATIVRSGPALTDDGLVFKSVKFSKIDDIIIYDFYSPNKGHSTVKIVLSGWKSNKIIALYGMMYMYQKRKQYNGVGLSFRQIVAD